MKDNGGGRIVTLTSASGLSGAFGRPRTPPRRSASSGSPVQLRGKACGSASRPTPLPRRLTPGCSRCSPPTATPRCATSPQARDLLGLCRIRRPADREPGHTDGARARAPQLPGDCRDFGATGGYYCRYAISHTEGATFGPNPSVEDIATNWDSIRDGSPPNELDGEAMAWGVKAYSTRLQALAAQLQTAESQAGAARRAETPNSAGLTRPSSHCRTTSFIRTGEFLHVAISTSTLPPGNGYPSPRAATLPPTHAPGSATRYPAACLRRADAVAGLRRCGSGQPHHRSSSRRMDLPPTAIRLSCRLG